MNYLREAARDLYHLRGEHGWDAVQVALEQMRDDEVDALLRTWQLWARPSQLRPEACRPIWLRMAGRGEGKTRSAAEDMCDFVEDWGDRFRGILCNKTIGDVRDVQIQGESGLEAICDRRKMRCRYVANRALVEFPDYGAMAHVLSSEKPDKPRGYQSNYIWGDEIAAWMNPIKVLDNLLFGWRLPVPHGGRPIAVFTTTPKPNPIMFTLAKSPQYENKVTISRGKMSDNAENLAPDAVELLESIYRGTRLGRQELDGELLETLGAIVDQDTIHRHRVRAAPPLRRRIVSLDPSITAKEDSDAAGITVLGSDDLAPPDAYLLADYTLEQATFKQWGRQTVIAFVEHDCDCVVAEVNQGGGGIVETIQTEAEQLSKELGREIVVPVRSVWAKESKQARAEPVGALYERGRVHHVGIFDAVEREFTTWLPGMASPNRMDSVVQGVAHLLTGEKEVGPLGAYI